MCFFLRVIDNTLIVREGRHFCKITILEDRSVKYKALHNLEKMLKGDFVANREYVVSKQGDRITFMNLHKHNDVSDMFCDKKIVDHCLFENNLFLLHHSSLTVFDLKKKSSKEHSLQLSSKPISVEVNENAVVILDSCNDLYVFSLPGRETGSKYQIL